jgi:hypothetical protein
MSNKARVYEGRKLNEIISELPNIMVEWKTFRNAKTYNSYYN